jgi:hypothetical protein
MKTIPVLLLLLLATFTSPTKLMASPQWDDDDVQTYDIANFNRIEIEGGYKVILRQSDKPALRIKADEEDFEYIDVNSDYETLSIKLKEKHFTFESMVLYIEFVELNEIEIEGGVKLETKGYVELNDFTLHVEGGAKIEMGMKANHFKVVGEGGVSFDFRGITKSMDARISGAGNLDADELKSESVTIEIEGVGGASVYATDYLKATIEGVGKIRYKGDPRVEKNIEGIGFVSPD